VITGFAAGRRSIPVEFIFNPNWWYRNYSIPFDKSFYLDKAARIENDRLMRRALYERFGFGEENPQPRPVIGSSFVAGGFVIPALLGLEIGFSESAAPWPVRGNLTYEEIRRLEVPDILSTWPMNRIAADIEELRSEFGYVVGDLNTDGVLNTAIHLRGESLLTDFYDEPEVLRHLFDVISRTVVEVAEFIREATGTCSVSVNRSIINFNPTAFVHANCALQMISHRLYCSQLLPWELYLAQRLSPYGIHHCGSNLELFSQSYSQLPVVFLDVGWGSDVAACRAAFPDAVLNLRLSPVRMLQQTADQVSDDARSLIGTAGSLENLGICCINMDHGTPDENIRAVMEVAENAADALAFRATGARFGESGLLVHDRGVRSIDHETEGEQIVNDDIFRTYYRGGH
jgi:hypothetical protein